MTDFLVRLAERAVAPSTGLRPRPLSRYERLPELGLAGLVQPSPAGEDAPAEEEREREAPARVAPRAEPRGVEPTAVPPAPPRRRRSVQPTVIQPVEEPKEEVAAPAEPRLARAPAPRVESAPPARPHEPEAVPSTPLRRPRPRVEAEPVPADPETRPRERRAERPVKSPPGERVVVRPAVVVSREREVRTEEGRASARDGATPPTTTAPISRRGAPAPVAETPPDVHVTIGRIEVRAVPEPKAAPSRSRAPVLTLEEYLRKRAGEAS